MPKKNWMFTIPNYADDCVPSNLAMFKYIVLGKEVGAGGLRHIQGFCILNEPMKFAAMKLLFPTWRNLENSRTSETACAAYCKKGEQSHEEWELLKTKGPSYGKNADVFEAGVLPDKGYLKKNSAKGGEATKRKWDDAWDLAKKGDVEAIDSKIRLTSYRVIRQVQKDYQKPPDHLDDVCGMWFYGPPGTGKSHTARDMGTSIYDKPCNKWWDGYQGEEIALIDDFDLNHKVLGHHLKRWTDRYAFPAESKGSTLQIRPKTIIVTSNYSIEEIFDGDEEMIKALRRRFQVRHFHEREWWKKGKSAPRWVPNGPALKKPRCVPPVATLREELFPKDDEDSISSVLSVHSSDEYDDELC